MASLVRSYSSGVATEQFYIQLQIKALKLEGHAPFQFSVAVFSGQQRQDGCSHSHRFTGEELHIKQCALNLCALHSPSTRKPNTYTIRLLRPNMAEDDSALEVALDLRSFLAEFLFQGASRSLVQFPLGPSGTLLVAVYIHSSRVKLLEEVKRYDLAEDNKIIKQEPLIESASEPVLGLKQAANRQLNNRLIAMPKVIERADQLESSTLPTEPNNHDKSTSRLRARVNHLPKVQTGVKQKLSTDASEDQAFRPFQGHEQQSPLVKLLNSRVPIGDQLGRAPKSKMKTFVDQPIKIKRTDSINEEEEERKRKCMKISLIGIVIFVLVFYLFVKLSKPGQVQKQPPKRKKAKAATRRNKS